ncbi:MAG: hypothetical protein KDE27_24585, partial [Planctomycetes bacterium]|nr:hypothetical protein [Planctomycetota bacterium]
MSAGRGELEWQRAQDEMLDRAARSAAHRGITLEQQLNVQRERAKQLEIARSKLLEERARMFDTLGAQNVVPTASLAEVLADRLRRDREDVAAA